MDKQTLQKQIRAMAAARNCCPQLKDEVKNYFAAVGTADEEFAAKNLIAEIEADITPIDKLVEFAHSARAIQLLGKEGARNYSAHAEALKAKGAKYCDCAACKPAAIILENKDILLDVEDFKKNLELKQALLKKVWEMAVSPSCHPNLREKVKRYFSVLGTPDEKKAAEDFIAKLKECVVPIELLVINAHSNHAIEMFGVAGAKKFAANADALKASGAKYCNCRACTIGLHILENKDVLLK